MTYDELLIEAEQEQLLVKEKRLLANTRLIKGKRIAIKKELTNKQKACVLAEELGHYFTTVGNIIDQTNIDNRKQERKARKWGYCKLVNIEGLVEACKQGCRNINEIAEYLEVTEEFLQDALTYFKAKYGVCYTVGQYTIYFNDFGYYVDMK